MALNKIKTEASWGESANNLNSNFESIETDLIKVKNATTRNKGYFSSSSALKSAFPTANVGDKAYVGSSYPYQIWTWSGSTWANSGSTGGEESVDLGNYYTKDETDEKFTETNEKLSQLGSEVDNINPNINSILDIELGHITSEGLPGNALDRARLKSFVNAPFEIRVSENYKIYNLIKYSRGFDGNVVYVEQESLRTKYFKTEDTNYIYKITFAKNDISETISETELSSIILDFKGSSSYTTGMVKKLEEKHSVVKLEVNSLNANMNSILKIETGGFYSDGTTNNAGDRARTSSFIESPFSVSVKEGYKVYKLYRYQIDCYGNISFVDEKDLRRNSINIDDDNYVYRILFSKEDLTEDIVNEELPYIVSDFKGVLYKLKSSIGELNSGMFKLFKNKQISYDINKGQTLFSTNVVFPYEANEGDIITIDIIDNKIFPEINSYVTYVGEEKPTSLELIGYNAKLSKPITSVSFYTPTAATENGVLSFNIRCVNSLYEDIKTIKDIHKDIDHLNLYKDSVIVDVKSDDVYSDTSFISIEDGVTAISSGCDRWSIVNDQYSHIKAKLGSNTSNQTVAIGFYSTDTISEESFLEESSVAFTKGINEYIAEVPTEAKLIVVSNRRASLEKEEVTIQAYKNQTLYFEDKIDRLKNLVDKTPIDGKVLGKYSLDYFISAKDGVTQLSSQTCDRWTITNEGYGYVKAQIGANTSNQALAIAFYSTNTITEEGFMKESSKPMLSGVRDYYAPIPTEAKLIVVFNRPATLAKEEVSLFVGVDQNEYLLKLINNPDYNIHLEVPEWYKENDYIDNKVSRINELVRECAGHGDAFIFITDEHVDYHIVNFRSPALIKYISERCPIGRLFNGGDTCNGQDERMKFFVDTIRNAFPYKIYSAMGNHEYMNMQTNSSLYSYFSWFNNDQVGSEKDRNYYYVDNIQQKIRYVVLSAYDISEATANNDDSLSKGATEGYEQEQLDWLENVALDVDSGWTIVVVTHMIVNVAMDSDSLYYGHNGSTIMSILNDYNSSGRGKVAFIIQGHSHRDRLRVSEGDVPIIVTTCDKCIEWKDDNGVADLNVDRTPGTINEQAFDVVVLDKKNRKITAVRIGAPALDGIGNDVGNPVEERVIYY